MRLAYDQAKRAEAEKLYREACSLLSKVYHLTQRERLCLEASLAKLREALGQGATRNDTQVRRAGA